MLTGNGRTDVRPENIMSLAAYCWQRRHTAILNTMHSKKAFVYFSRSFLFNFDFFLVLTYGILLLFLYVSLTTAITY